MLSIKFILKEPNKDKSLIYLYVFYGQKRPFKYSTSEIVPSRFWNKDSQRVREVRDFLRARSINKTLSRYERFVESLFSGEGILSADDIRKELDIFSGKREKVDADNFISRYKGYIDNNGHRTNIKSYITTFNAIRELMPSQTKISEVDYLYLEKFAMLFSKRPIKRYKNIGRLPSLNYVSQQIKNVKAVLHYYERHGVALSPTINNYSKVQEQADNVYLTRHEIEKIRNLDLPERLGKVRDIFLIGCYTAMRVSDYKTLSSDNIRNELIFKTTKKTGERVVLPLHTYAKDILLKYDLKLPRISDQRLNDYIKEVCRLAGINETVIITRTEGGEKVTRKHEKWELVTSHTARRSGATNMYLAGIPPISIMMITGHKTEKAFMKYIKVTREQNAQILANHEFFK